MKEPKDTVILIVDDEPDLREAIAFDFRRKGYQVLLAESGNQAFEIAQKHVIDVVISDVRMPNGDGLELLERLKTKDPFMPVVMFITGFADVTIEEAYARGADALFSKPFDRKALFEAVQNTLIPVDVRCKRKGSRVELALPVGIRFEESGLSLTTTTINVGRGGMYVAVPSPGGIKLLHHAEFSLEVPGPAPWPIKGRGVVRWVRTRDEGEFKAGCGIEFEWLEDDSIRRLLELINQIKTRSFIPRK